MSELKFTPEQKANIAKEYLDGFTSSIELAKKYNVNNYTIRRWAHRYEKSGILAFLNWISCYNANRKFKDYNPKKEVYMAEARRKTTIEERREIVKYCLEHNRNYKETASNYDVSYNQVYTWVKKYDIKGEAGLLDKRGQHKSDDEVDELEKLRRENFRLKRQLEEKDMVIELLKKVKEFERK